MKGKGRGAIGREGVKGKGGGEWGGIGGTIRGVKGRGNNWKG